MRKMGTRIEGWDGSSLILAALRIRASPKKIRGIVA
jgi:hypothetical protein